MSFLLFGLGLVIGSFLNALIYRTRVGEKVTRGRSKCPHCGHELAVIDLVPIVSWLALRGKCRYCGRSISWQYPLVELATGALFAWSAAVMNPSSMEGWVGLALWLYILSSLIFLAVYDLKWFILPDKILLPAIGVGLVWLMVRFFIEAESASLIRHLASAFASGGAFYALAALSRGRWLGGGDIKLAFLMGLVLGPSKTLLAMLMAFNGAAIIGLVLIGLKIKSRKDMIPFGPFLVAGTVVAFLAGDPVIEWYMNLTDLGLL